MARFAMVPDSSQASLVGFVRGSVEEGAVVLTDGWQGYAPPRHLCSNDGAVQRLARQRAPLQHLGHRALVCSTC
jgi:hypothetical protein